MTGTAHPTRLAFRGLTNESGSSPNERGSLFVRDVGEGVPIIVVHGGPDFDHTYLLPELDVLTDLFRLVYYDQRGRGRSAVGVAPEDVTMESEISDLDALRESLGVRSVALLGHSWGGLLATEYAARHPGHVSHLVLMNTAPLSREDSVAVRDWLDRNRPPDDAEEMRAVASTDAYAGGDPNADRAYYRAHFRMATTDQDELERVVGRLRTHFTPETILLARAIEDRLYGETWRAVGYDAAARSSQHPIPTLVIHGEHDFVPVAVAARVARQLPLASLLVLPGCAHFCYLERPEEVRRHVAAFMEA